MAMLRIVDDAENEAALQFVMSIGKRMSVSSTMDKK